MIVVEDDWCVCVVISVAFVVAYKDFPADVDLNYDDEVGLISQLTCIAITGIEDPVRDEVSCPKIDDLPSLID